MFRYTQDCPDCNGLGKIPCPTCQAPGEWRCLNYPDYTCPFTGVERDPPKCSRCDGSGQLFITETTSDHGEITRTEVSAAHESSHYRNSVRRHCEAIDAFTESIYEILDMGYADSYHLAHPQDIEEELASGMIQDALLREQLPKEGMDALGLKHTKNGSFLIVLGRYGIYLPKGDQYLYIPREDLAFAAENADMLLVEYTEELRNLKIARTEENSLYLRPIRLLLQELAGDWKDERKDSFSAFKISRVFQRYAKKLCKHGSVYTFDPARRPEPGTMAEKKLRRVLFSYAAKIRRKDVLFFVDASEGNANDRGLVFGFEGLSFCNGTNYGYIPYERIRDITGNKSRTAVTLHGVFDECVKSCRRVSFRSTEYNIDALEACIRDLLFLV